jgi:hypothetical protein
MPADVANGLPDSRPIHRLIRQTRALLRSTWVVTGLGLTTGLLVGALFAVTGADLLLPFGNGLRLLALLLVAVPAVWAAVVGVALPLARRLTAVGVARRIEERLPGIHNRLVSCIDLETARGRAVSPTFHRRLLTEALERIRGFRPRQAVDLASLRRAGAFAGGAAAAFAVVWMLFPDRMPTAMARLFFPFADIPPASGVAYDVTPGTADVLREEKVTFAARVTKGEPEELRLELRPAGGGPTRWFDLARDRQDPARWKATLDTVSLGDGFRDGFRYRVHGGGTWSKEYRISLVERPVLVSVNTAVHYPAYMALLAPQPTPPQAARVVGPEGGEVEVAVRAEGDVASGEVQLLAPGTRRLAPEEQAERAWFDDKPPLGSTEDGTWVFEKFQRRLVHTEPPSLGPHGHWFQGDPVGFAVNPGDVLFAWVYLPAGQRPESVMLEWHDGEGWEHRAYWGRDAFRDGKPNTPGRRPAGGLPDADTWVRLEVPAAAVGLENKTLRGMAFKLAGGQAYWGHAGAVRLTEPTVVVTKSLPMLANGDGTWSGRFPLQGSGMFRAELRNRAGHPNKPMKELEFLATPDQPPQIVVERPGNDLVLSTPAALPLTVAAYDDYGLKQIDLLFRTADGGEFQRRTLHRFSKPQRSHTLVTQLPETAKLAVGGQFRYALEASDRKGQVARTREFLLRVAADPNAADQQLAAFEKSQDPFRDRLIQLIAEQKKIQAAVEKTNKEYAGVLAKLRAAEEEFRAEAPKVDPTTGKPLPNQGPSLDPETMKRLAELRAELDKLAKEEQKALAAAEQIDRDLANAAQQADKLEMLPRQIAAEMAATEQTFRQMVVNAMRDVGGRMSQGADPKSASAPDVPGIQERGDRLVKELEGIKDRQEATDAARKKLRENLEKALAELRDKMLAAEGDLDARELGELRDYIARLREQMKQLQNREDELGKADDDPKADRAKLGKRREMTEEDVREALEKAKNLLARAKERRRDRRPDFPDSPYSPEGEEKLVPPREEDSNEPLPSKDKAGQAKTDPNAKDDKKKEMDEDEDDPKKFMPALAGPREKEDPRFAGKKRPVERKNDGKDDDRERQARDQDALDAADRALNADQKALDRMMSQLRDVARASRQGKPREGDDGEPDLSELLRSPLMQEAMAMAGRMRRGPPPRGPRAQANQAPPAPAPNTNPNPGANQMAPPLPKDLEAELARLDPDSRAALMKLQPRLREELLQGMREQGPEGYAPFIQDYFRRLTEAKPPVK